ncbi:50S ribosomal protein L6 [Halococcus hamelinensis]|uniref:Large ribosomal subunit protein uL6 n=1 Tax=Halococcus hamelinensis 100A6 TaxID=1132509 RepID=M0LQK9_9EURY|nr:50S ribosomal protein L6 [Halococcus hamelinensis]EMA35771.1 50S ribosomal protein L6P [Halococcus hamelinensis 100A6]
MTEERFTIPDGASAETERFDLTISGENGSVTRRLWYPNVSVDVDGDEVVIETAAEDAKTNAIVGTFTSHIQNAFHGVSEGWTYEMEVFYSHFPMQVRVEDGEVVIQNFLGERAPRRTRIHGDTQVDVDDEQLTLSGPSKDDVGQTAADIEQLTRVSGKDVRVFQDGVYITQKPKRAEVTAGGS